MLDELTRRALADELWKADTAAETVTPITERHHGFDEADAYAVQAELVRLHLDAGRRVVGKKVGLTNAAAQQATGGDRPDFGRLFDVMEQQTGETIDLDALVAPRVEPEIAFVLKSGLRGSVTTSDVLAATEYVTPVIEVVDSRIADWRVRWHDTVADNASSARFVLAHHRYSPLDIDLESVTVTVERNGRPEATGGMRDVLGGPLHSVCWLAAELSAHGLSIEPGDVVLPGSPCPAVAVGNGDQVRATFGALGAVDVRFEHLSSPQLIERSER